MKEKNLFSLKHLSLGKILLIFLLIYIALIVIPYIQHKKVAIFTVTRLEQSVLPISTTIQMLFCADYI